MGRGGEGGPRGGGNKPIKVHIARVIKLRSYALHRGIPASRDQPGPAPRALVAVSGGPDSVALLDLLVRTADMHGLTLVVAHVDHGIHPDSTRVAEGVRALARSYGLPVEVGELELGPSAGETMARSRRYAWLEEARARVGAAIILTAHHADDQAETVLMRVLEGAGRPGWQGWPGRGPLVRPLLPFRRVELAAHRERGLAAWLDPANADPGIFGPGSGPRSSRCCATRSRGETQPGPAGSSGGRANARPGMRCWRRCPGSICASRTGGFPLLRPPCGL